MASHADETRGILGAPSSREKWVLSSFRHSRNLAVLHTAQSLMPRRPGGLVKLELYRFARQCRGCDLLCLLDEPIAEPGHGGPCFRHTQPAAAPALRYAAS